jgi:GTP-binding protein
MKLSADFISSVSTVGGYPRWDRKEIALAGRSNVGKSSLLNALVERRGLARTSKTPGCTRAVNFFGLGANLALVDLPGFGYAKMGRSEAAQIGILVKDYLSRRELLRALVLLVDARRGPQEEEMSLLKIQTDRSPGCYKPVAMIVVATKSDKLRRSERNEAIGRFAEFGIEPIMCSAISGEGIDLLRRRIMNVAADRP